ncbi:trans-sulfuration enzyme family protein [Fuchsiella alkaliacetigena]|uniref:trans-sulfuration enzyme family protein n=1 Tax=Fuchsiella alkaliacetigena TaxID=957042 RepID=UPI00200B2E4D|nr:PLP-dependent aspartate aminotransferase family protein [Fuchsiella alkaliacetigena]MCK8824148.1 PLP-dependent aspartate aminotransferase family protein [Fuchsiella alkaliacetigena]
MSKSIATKVVHGSQKVDPYTGAVSFPIYQSATFKHLDTTDQRRGYDYSREQNPTRQEVEESLAILEAGTAAFAYSSGMAAITDLFKLFSPGEQIVVADDLYGGTYRLFEEIYAGYGLEFTYVDTSEIENVLAAVQENTKAIFLETPSNPTMKVTDIAAVAEIAQNNDLLTIVDNTFLTPYYQQPLQLGADIVVHSGTKFLGGHNDTLAGFTVVKDEELADSLSLIQKSVGAVLSPFDSWLMLRGIKTLGVRMDKQQSNALQIAEFLQEHQQVEEVFYVGLSEHEGYDISCKQASGFGAMISFTVKEPKLVEQLLESLEVITFAESLGGVESLITHPVSQTHQDIPESILSRLGITESLLRLSVGIEAAEDLVEDLERGLKN